MEKINERTMISEHYTPEAVILANGEYPTHVLPLKILEEAKFVICCDGAANEYILRGHTPDIIIGDGDSLSPENKTRFSDIIHHIADQETNFGAKGLKGEGLVYPLSDFTNWWQGTLNEATSNRFTIQCTGEYLVFLASI